MAGRPKKPRGERRDNVLRIRLTPEERQRLDRAAAHMGEDTSTWARVELTALADKVFGTRRR